MVQTDFVSTKVAVPYVPFPTLITALDHLKIHGTPDNINSSVFPGISGGMVSHLLLSLRFLGAINNDGVPQPLLSELVDEKTRKQALAKVIPHAYSELFKKVELAKASPSTLDSALKEANVHGATHKKAKSFLIKAAQYAGLTVSSHLVKRTRRSGPRTNGSGGQRRTIEKLAQPDESQRTADGDSVTVQLRNGGSVKLILSVKLGQLTNIDDRTFVFELLDKMSAYGQKAVTQ